MPEIHLDQINYLAVLVATIVGFAVGGLWYSPLCCGKAWMTEMKLTEADITPSRSSSWV